MVTPLNHDKSDMKLHSKTIKHVNSERCFRSVQRPMCSTRVNIGSLRDPKVISQAVIQTLKAESKERSIGWKSWAKRKLSPLTQRRTKSRCVQKIQNPIFKKRIALKPKNQKIDSIMQNCNKLERSNEKTWHMYKYGFKRDLKEIAKKYDPPPVNFETGYIDKYVKNFKLESEQNLNSVMRDFVNKIKI